MPSRTCGKEVFPRERGSTPNVETFDTHIEEAHLDDKMAALSSQPSMKSSSDCVDGITNLAAADDDFADNDVPATAVDDVNTVNDNPTSAADVDDDAILAADHYDTSAAKDKHALAADDPSGVTEAMKREEEALQEKIIKEEEARRQEAKAEALRWDEQLREQRFKRLEFLLNKSSLYTKYLVQRMEQQKQSNQVVSKDTSAESGHRESKNTSLTSDLECKENKPKTSRVSAVNVADTPVGHGRVSRSSSRVSAKESTLSAGCQGIARSDKCDEPSKSTRSAGKKRKRDDITEYLGEAIERSKRRKAAEEEANEDTPQSSQTSSQETPVDQPILLTGGVLRKYQLEGFNWLRILYENGINGILADEMGLGKTIQCIASVAHLVMQGVTGPFLVVGPLSTVPNWVAEFNRFAPKVPVLMYHGTQEERHALRSQIAARTHVVDNISVQPVVITSYQICMNDRVHIQNFNWKYIIVDEGHRIKNFQCRLVRDLKLYRSTHRLLLTGTPLQNNLSELWSLLNFLLPEIFDDLGSFEAWFDADIMESCEDREKLMVDEQRKLVLSMLHQILTPFIGRGLKSDVDLMIPPKREVIVYAQLSALQKEYYSSTVDKTIRDKLQPQVKTVVEYDGKGRPKRRCSEVKPNYQLLIDDDDSDDIEAWVKQLNDSRTLKESSSQRRTNQVEHRDSLVHIKLQNVIMQLRRCVNHPYLIEYPLVPGTTQFKVDEEIVQSCGKLRLLDCMLLELKKRGHKVLIFSQMTSMLDILQDYCYLRQYGCCRLDGTMGIHERKEQMEDFNTKPDMFIFLLSTRAGGLGINLTAADTVIIYDSDWNPQSDLQAQDRCHRIGQTRPVMIYRLVTYNTVDQKIVERAAAKRCLEKMVIHKGKFKTGLSDLSNNTSKPLSHDELLELLRSTEYEKVDIDKIADVITHGNLKMLLDRSDLDSSNSKDKRGKLCSVPRLVPGVYQILSDETSDITS